MESANVAEFKKHLSSYLERARNGETIEIRKRNVPIAELKGLPSSVQNRTKLGLGKETVIFHGSVTDPFMDAGEWEMLAGSDS